MILDLISGMHRGVRICKRLRPTASKFSYNEVSGISQKLFRCIVLEFPPQLVDASIKIPWATFDVPGSFQGPFLLTAKRDVLGGRVQKFTQDPLFSFREGRYIVAHSFSCLVKVLRQTRSISATWYACSTEMVVDTYSPSSNNACMLPTLSGFTGEHHHFFHRKQDVPELSSAETEMIHFFETAKKYITVGMLSGFRWTT